ncbi:L-ascorbate oxidase homolog [Arachis stenosperma]|uniref:L-ascorbate oxidase homolog n=1 Tax=Arachis stenosperma TaxID=217475 RepID=UPI0025ABB19C|nr:L-ascorbate oxidase homolog [Arachis stenosperma]
MENFGVDYSKTYARSKYYDEAKPWNERCDAAFACASQNEIEQFDAINLVNASCRLLVEGSNMPYTPEAADFLKKASVLFAPAMATGAGEVVAGELELNHECSLMHWSPEDFESKLQGILINGGIGDQKRALSYVREFSVSRIPLQIIKCVTSHNSLEEKAVKANGSSPVLHCPIPPGKNFTHVIQLKDQIGSFFCFPSLKIQKAAGGFGAIRIWSRPGILVPFPLPAQDYIILAGDWYKRGHHRLMHSLWRGHNLPFPDGLVINGRGWNGITFTVHQGNTYRLRISNVGLTTSINMRIQGHKMKLVEVEGSHTIQNTYSFFDIHLGQTYSIDQPPKDYYIVVFTRFTRRVLTTKNF